MSADNARRLVYLLISVAALLLGIYAAAGLTGLSEPPPGFASEKVRYPARLGSIVVGSPEELRFVLQSRPPGSAVELSSGGAVRRTRLIPQLPQAGLLIILLVGITFFAVNLIVFCPRIDRGAVWDFYWCTLLYGLAVLINGLYFPRGPGVLEVVLPLVWLACVTALPVFFLRMTVVFPKKRKLVVQHPGWIRLVEGMAGALFLWQALACLRYFAAPGPSAWSALHLARHAAGIFLVMAVATGCLILYQSSRSLELAREREQTKWLLWGFTIGVTPYVFLRTLPLLFGIPSRIPSEIDRVFELAIPMAFTFAVIRHRFLDIDIIIRRSLIYGILAGVISAVYFLIVSVAGERLGTRFPQSSSLVRTVAVAVSILLFHPTRRWVGAWVDRTFFQIRHGMAQALLSLEPSMRMASSQDAIARITQLFLQEQLALKSAGVITRERTFWVIAGDWDPDRATRDVVTLEPFVREGRNLLAAPNTMSRPEVEAEDFPEDLLQRGARILVPLRSGAALLGWILLGPKQNERRFVEEEMWLLDRVRKEAVDALERVELVQLASREALEREKAEFKSGFFAGIAHDMRTPLTSIRWTVENLLDGVGAPLSPAHAESLRAVLIACRQLSMLMDDFLDVSRLQDPRFELRCAAVDLVGVVSESVASLRSVADAHRAKFRVHATPELPRVRGDHDKVQRIVLNLLENALRYSPHEGTVEVSMLPKNGSGVQLVVRDHGPGLCDEDLERVFGPYERGSGRQDSDQRGFGLGLHIVRQFAEMMDGSVEASNHPEGGACFVCTLPEWEGS